MASPFYQLPPGLLLFILFSNNEKLFTQFWFVLPVGALGLTGNPWLRTVALESGQAEKGLRQTPLDRCLLGGGCQVRSRWPDWSTAYTWARAMCDSSGTWGSQAHRKPETSARGGTLWNSRPQGIPWAPASLLVPAFPDPGLSPDPSLDPGPRYPGRGLGPDLFWPLQGLSL